MKLIAVFPDIVRVSSIPSDTTMSVAAKAKTPSLKASTRLILCRNFMTTDYLAVTTSATTANLVERLLVAKRVMLVKIAGDISAVTSH